MQSLNDGHSHENNALQPVSKPEQTYSQFDSHQLSAAPVVALAAQTQPLTPMQRIGRWMGFRERSGFEWMQFAVSIAVTLLLGGLTWKQGQINIQQNQNAEKSRIQQEELAKQNHFDEILSNYLNQITYLMVEGDLRQSNEGSEARSAARAITLNALRQLDGNQNGNRKGELLKFLYEADLIGGCQSTSEVTKVCPAIVELSEAKLDGATYERPLFIAGADLDQARLRNAYLPGIWLDKAEMNGVRLEGAVLTGAILTDAQMEGANLTGVQLASARLHRANLTKAILEHAVLNGAKLQGAILTEANLEGAQLQGATLTKANLKGAILQGADLRGANLSEAKLQGANLKGAIYDSKTIFPGDNPNPTGFDPENFGMVRQSVSARK